MFADASVAGRWMSAKFPPIRRGRSAASLSSGCITSPYRSKVSKSSVVASATPGPALPKAVYARTYFFSSSTQVMRGSSIPHSSSG